MATIVLMVEMDSMNEVLCDLSARLGHEIKLKDEQIQAIEHLLNGRDVLVVLPTGFGNCLIFHAVRQDFCWK